MRRDMEATRCSNIPLQPLASFFSMSWRFSPRYFFFLEHSDCWSWPEFFLCNQCNYLIQQLAPTSGSAKIVVSKKRIYNTIRIVFFFSFLNFFLYSYGSWTLPTIGLRSVRGRKPLCLPDLERILKILDPPWVLELEQYGGGSTWKCRGRTLSSKRK